MVLARNEALPDSRDAGLDGRRLAIYSSELGHYSIRKSAGMLGIGRSQVREIATDAEGRMRPELLEEALRADLRDGAIPVMINAAMKWISRN